MSNARLTCSAEASGLPIVILFNNVSFFLIASTFVISRQIFVGEILYIFIKSLNSGQKLSFSSICTEQRTNIKPSLFSLDNSDTPLKACNREFLSI